jgi:hypothetical protein
MQEIFMNNRPLNQPWNSNLRKLVAALAMLLNFSACGSGGGDSDSTVAEEDPRKQGYLVAYLYDNFISVDRDFFEKIAQKYLAKSKSYTGNTSPYTVAYTYDEQNRIALETITSSSTTNTITHTYDGDRLAEIRETLSGASDTVITPAFSEEGVLTAYSKTYFDNTTTRTLKFDNSGRLSGADIQSATDNSASGVISLTYDANGLLTTVESRTIGGQIMDQIRVTLDATAGNRISEFAEYSHGSVHIKTLKFTYDASTGFIASAQVLSGIPASVTGSITFTFDEEGRAASLGEVSSGTLMHSVRYTY